MLNRQNSLLLHCQLQPEKIVKHISSKQSCSSDAPQMNTIPKEKVSPILQECHSQLEQDQKSIADSDSYRTSKKKLQFILRLIEGESRVVWVVLN